MSKPSILTFLPYYLPGHEAGGPIRTIENMVGHLGDEFQFRIVTSDRDSLDSEPYENITPGTWTEVQDALVHYTPPEERSFSALKELINETPHDALYLNSFFFPDYTIKPLILRRMGLVPDRPVVLAPRGEFSKGAFQIKRIKKQAFVTVARLLGLYDGVTWQASSRHEAEDIRQRMGDGLNIQIAPNLPPPPTTGDREHLMEKWRRKEEGQLRVLFLSRISPKKNIIYTARILKNISENIQFTIAGPIGDESCWNRFTREVKMVPDEIEVEYLGSVEHEKVQGVMAAHDLFFLPTKGENYGHVIQEAASAGTPLLISDQTPWRDLEEEGVGWDLSLDNVEDFRDAIRECVGMGPEEYRAWREDVMEWGHQQQESPERVEKNRALFEEVL